MPATKPFELRQGVPAIVLVLSLGFTLLVWLAATSISEAKVQERFQEEAQQITESIAARMRLYENTLYGAQGLFDASDVVSRKEFKTFVERQRVNERFPGVQCIGFSKRLAPSEVKTLEASVQAEGFADFHIRPEEPREQVHTILYIEPFEGRNLRPFGYNMFSEPVRRAAMEFARDNDTIGFSGRVTLLQETSVGVQPGALMYLPIYAQGLPRGTVEERRVALTGFVYAAFRMNDLMRGVLSSRNINTNLEIFDDANCLPDTKLFGEAPDKAVGAIRELTTTRPLKLYNRVWTLRFQPKAAFIAEAHGTGPKQLLGAGVIISILLFLISVSLSRVGRQAQTLANEMTDKLRESEEAARLMVEAVNDYAIIRLDTAGKVVGWNAGAERLKGYRGEEIPGNSIELFYRAEDRAAGLPKRLLDEARQNGRAETEGWRVRKDGSQFWAEVLITALHGPKGELRGFTKITRDVTERRRASHQQEMLKFAFDQHAIVAVTDTAGVITHANDRFCAISGYSRAELLGQTHRIVNSGVHGRAFFATMWKSIVNGAVWHGEICNRAKNGTLYWVDSSIVPLKDQSGQVEAYVSIRTDITERKAAEHAFREQEEQLRLTLEAAEIGTWDTDMRTRRTRWGGSHAVLFGLARNEDYAGTRESFLEFVMPEDHLVIETGVRNAINHRGLAIMEYRIRRRDTQEIRWMASRGRILFDDNDQPVRMVGIVRDVTKRRSAEEALREKSLAMEHAVEGIALLDEHGRFAEANRAFATLAGCEAGELETVELQTIINPLEWTSVKDAIDRMWQVGKAEIECCGLHKNGLPFYMHCVFSRTTSGSDRSGGYYCFAKDITERKRAEEALRAAREETDAVNQHLGVMNQQLEEAIQKANEMAMRAEYANQAKSEFLATMSHEIRTPMNGIIGFTSLLCDTDLNSEQRDFAETIRNSGQALLTLINDILDFSKIEAGKLAVESAPFELRLAVEEVADLLANNAESRGLELLLNIDANCPRELTGDSSRVRQILLNLIGNAIKFTHEGHVLVDVRCEAASESAERFVRFGIVDTGIGIPESKQRQLFQPFTQADTSTTRHYGGTGLGLAICKRLVELLGGSIGLDSIPGRGSTFWFTLPVAQNATPAPSLLFNPEEFSGRRVLLLHPYPLARAMFAAQFQAWNMEVSSLDKADDAARALQIASESSRPFDAILTTLDLQLSLRPNLASQHGAVVVLSRNSQRAEVRRMLGHGLHAQLQTPVVRPVALAAALRAGIQSVAGRAGSLESRRVQTQMLHQTADVRPVTRYRVLLADDNIVNQKLAVKMLEKLGCSVDLACNGREAVELAQQLPYDLVFMDCHMPEMDGFEATAEIRKHSASERRIPIVAVTADALAGDREKCLDAGMDGYISKPIKRDDLSRALEQWCSTTVCK